MNAEETGGAANIAENAIVSSLTISELTKRFQDVEVVKSLDLEVRAGEFLTLLGPSGCGKTTTLRMIAGFVSPTSGRISIDGETITDLPPQRRQIGMVFQDYALFPHLTIAENVAFGLVERRVSRDRISPRVRELLELVRLPEVADRLPSQLSGGQQQRVALARAIAFPPRLLLMDEPLGALDLKMREYMQIELRRIQQELGLTTIYVTHDQVEAMTMSDRIAVMNAGKIEQLDSPEQIYNAPRTKFVANFVGKVNFMTGRVTRHLGSESAIETEDGTLLCRLVQQPVGTSVTMAVRPERLKLFSHHGDVAGMNALHGSVASETFCGNLLHLSVRLRNSSTVLVESKPGEGRWKSGDDVTVAWKAEDAVIMAA